MKPTNAEIRRQMGMDMPTAPRDMASEVYTVTRKSFEEPEKKKLNFQIVMGIWMVDDGDGWRSPTAEELEKHTGGVICLQSSTPKYVDQIEFSSVLPRECGKPGQVRMFDGHGWVWADPK